MNQLPMVTSQVQLVTLALTALLLLAVIAVIGMLWRMRGPVNFLILTYLQSVDGRKAIADGIRAYLSLPEGVIYMEGVINGKVRREIAIHDAVKHAHMEILKNYATELELNGATNTLRQRTEHLEKICNEGRETVLGKIKTLQETVEKK